MIAGHLAGEATHFDYAFWNTLSFLLFLHLEDVVPDTLIFHSPRASEVLIRVCRQDVIPIFRTRRRLGYSCDHGELQGRDRDGQTGRLLRQ